MRTVLLNQKTVLIYIVVHIAADMVPALPNGDLLSLFRKVTGYDGPGKATADYKIVHIVTIPLCSL